MMITKQNIKVIIRKMEMKNPEEGDVALFEFENKLYICKLFQYLTDKEMWMILVQAGGRVGHNAKKLSELFCLQGEFEEYADWDAPSTPSKYYRNISEKNWEYILENNLIDKEVLVNEIVNPEFKLLL